MSNITIDLTKPVSTFTFVFRQAVVWSFMVASEAAAHLWFGGSWVIDIMILVVLGLLITNYARRGIESLCPMTKPELRLWVAAGMPDDVKAWRDARRAEAA